MTMFCSGVNQEERTTQPNQGTVENSYPEHTSMFLIHHQGKGLGGHDSIYEYPILVRNLKAKTSN